jgi:hypothetical protein
MPARTALVIGETPSLATAVADLLLADGLDVVLLSTLADGETWAATAEPGALFVVVAAANGHRCETVLRWPESALHQCDLVVVGAREVDRTYRPRLHIVPLPLDPRQFVALIRGLLGLALHERSGYADPAGTVLLGVPFRTAHRSTSPLAELLPPRRAEIRDGSPRLTASPR